MKESKLSMGLKRPRKIIDYYLKRNARYIKDDKLFIDIRWWCNMGYRLNWNELQTYNEKLQWIKLYDHNPLYTILVDKVEAKKYAAKIIGEKYIIPTLGVWERAEDIIFDSLPDKFVLKCNHNSGKGMCICTDKSKLDIAKVRRQLNAGLEQNYYFVNREWPYKNVPRRILAEKFISPVSLKTAIFYRFYCVKGEPRYCRMLNGVNLHEASMLYNMDWEPVRKEKKSNEAKLVPCPPFFCSMQDVARNLAKEDSLSIVDIYNVDNLNFIGKVRDDLMPSQGDVYDNSAIMDFVMSYVPSCDEKIPLYQVSVPNAEINDYKFYCLNGKIACILVCTGRKQGVKYYFFSKEWKFLRWDKETQYEKSDCPVSRPENLDEMIKIAELLAEGLPSVRIDLYNIQGQIYFGEFTFFTNSGMDRDITRECDELLGQMLILPKVKN